MKTNYFISIGQNSVVQDNTIHDPCTKLKVKVTNLVKSQFKPTGWRGAVFCNIG
jgi:hypothetical protein